MNDSPVDCQSRDRAERRQLPRVQRDWGIVKKATPPPSVRTAPPPLTQGRFSAAAGLGLFGTPAVPGAYTTKKRKGQYNGA